MLSRVIAKTSCKIPRRISRVTRKHVQSSHSSCSHDNFSILSTWLRCEKHCLDTSIKASQFQPSSFFSTLNGSGDIQITIKRYVLCNQPCCLLIHIPEWIPWQLVLWVLTWRLSFISRAQAPQSPENDAQTTYKCNALILWWLCKPCQSPNRETYECLVLYG